MKTKVKSLTKKETEKLKTIMDNLEAEAYYPFKKLSGGFSEANVFNYDEDFIDIELKSGVQNGTDSVIYSEQLLIDRHSMEFIN